MAEEEVDEQAEKQEASAPRRSRLGQFILLTVIVLLGQGIIVYMLITRFVIPRQQAATGEAEEKTVGHVTVSERTRMHIEAPLLYQMEDIQVNPRDEEALRFISAKVILQMNHQDALNEMNDKVVASRVREIIVQKLATMPYAGINSAEEREKLRESLKQWINESGVLKSGEVVAVYFEHFIVQ